MVWVHTCGCGYLSLLAQDNKQGLGEPPESKDGQAKLGLQGEHARQAGCVVGEEGQGSALHERKCHGSIELGHGRGSERVVGLLRP